MSLFEQVLASADAEIDQFFSDPGTLHHPEGKFEFRGILDREITEDGTNSSGMVSVSTVISVLTNTIPKDPRGGTVILTRESIREGFDVIDYDNDKQGRTLLIVMHVADMSRERTYSGYPYIYADLYE